MINRKRSVPWLHRWSRYIIAAIAAFGVLETIYLTILKLSGSAAACPTESCDRVLNSPYAVILGIPLPILGLLGYAVMGGMAIAPLLINAETNKQLKSKLEELTWLGLFIGSTAMVFFSSYLMYIMAFIIGQLCIYCVTSALFTLTFFIITLNGKEWEDIGQLFFTGIIVAMVTLISTIGIYANIDKTAKSTSNPTGTSEQTQYSLSPVGEMEFGIGWPIRNSSGPAEIELARYLKETGITEYSAFWCPHCHEQKELFGKEAFNFINSTECDPRGKKNPQPDVCKAVGIKGFPTWKINGQLYDGVQSLEKLADLTGYKGRRDFQRTFPSR